MMVSKGEGIDMKVISGEQVQKEKVDMEGAERAYKQVPISREDGSPNFSFRLFTLEPGGHTPYHRHSYEHLNYVIKGSGALVSEGERKQTITQGDFALVLPNEIHQYRNESEDGPLVIICAVPKEYE